MEIDKKLIQYLADYINEEVNRITDAQWEFGEMGEWIKNGFEAFESINEAGV